MISKHIARKAKNDNYRRLARYIADAGHDGEKSLCHWCAGCWSGSDEYELAIGEVLDTQALNTRSGKEKTYHLLISFRPEDEDKLSVEIFKNIEEDFAKVLGLSEHQRHCGVHKNTDNLHLHVAYNLIHPERKTRHEPYRDFWLRDKLCRELEIKYGLKIDKGRNREDPPKRSNERAKNYEAQSGQQSLDGYIIEHKNDLITTLNLAKSWQDLHQGLNAYGLEIKPRGAGLIIQDKHQGAAVKASALGRDFAKNALEKRLGPFQTPGKNAAVNVSEKSRYIAKPLQQNYDRESLYQRFKSDMEKRQKILCELNDKDLKLRTEIKNKWQAKIKQISKIPMLKADHYRLLQLIRKKEKEELAAARKPIQAQREIINRQLPKTWADFLKRQADQGDETALAILRSKRKKMEPDKFKTGFEKKQLTAVAQMELVLKKSSLAPLKYRIDNKGTIIFTLPSGGSIRDAGPEIHYSHHDKQAETLAKELAKIRWGRETILDNNIIRQPVTPEPNKAVQKAQKGFSR